MRLFLILLLTTCILCENTNFTYSQHGSDWNGKGICKGGDHQSPVNLTHNTTAVDSFLFPYYSAVTANITFYNTTIYIGGAVFGQLYTMTSFGKALSMKATEMRFRCKAEHQIVESQGDNATKYDLEIQIVHTPIYQAENDKLTVSLFFKTSPTAKPDPNLQAIMDARSSNSTLVTFDLSRYLSINNNYNFWTYLGSPTMPYCTDNTVNWIVLEKPYEITQEQGDFFSKMFYQEFQKDGNWRAAQRNVNTLGFYDFMSQ